MHRTIKILLFLIILLSSASPLLGVGKERAELAEELYLKGLALFERGEHQAALDMFDQAIRYNRKHADAWHMAAKALMEENTIHSRFLATFRMEKALRLDWRNPQYRFTNAVLYLKKDMSGIAFNEFEKVIKYDSDNYKAYFEMGKILEENAIRYRDMIDPDPGGTIYFRKFAEKDKDRIIYYYNKVIALNPSFVEVYYRLALIYYEFGSLEDMIKLLEAGVKVNSDDKNTHLFLGFAYNLRKDFENADEQFKAAFELMNSDEQVVFLNIETILSPDEQEEFEKLDDVERAQFVKNFWTRKDPLYLTDFNERKLEHFSRVAYANMRYSKFEKNIEGWSTDQGKVYIRYGHPQSMYRTRPEFGGMGASEFGALSTSKEVWMYDEFNFVFDDRFLSNRYEFAWGDLPENDYRTVFHQLIKESPDVHEIVDERDRLEIALSHSSFYSDSTHSELYVNSAFPADSIYFIEHDGEWKANLKHGLYMFDLDWNRIDNFEEKFMLQEESKVELNDNSYLLDQMVAQTGLDSFNIAYEIYDIESERLGTFRGPISTRIYDKKRLQLSDIMLSFLIESERADTFSFAKDDLKIVSNPLGKFEIGAPVSIYYEIYGLELGVDGLTSFSLEYTIMRNEQKVGMIRKLLTSLRLMKDMGDVTTTFEYQGNSEIEHQYQQINLSPKLRGPLTLGVKVKDRVSGKSVEKWINFWLE